MTQRNATNYKNAKRTTHVGMVWRTGALTALTAAAMTLSGCLAGAAAAGAGAGYAAGVETADDESTVEGAPEGEY